MHNQSRFAVSQFEMQNEEEIKGTITYHRERFMHCHYRRSNSKPGGAIPQQRDTMPHNVAGDHSPNHTNGLRGQYMALQVVDKVDV